MAVPPTIICAYCGAETQFCQLVSQVPTSFCPQSFILSEIEGRNGDLLKPDQYICDFHEYTFGVKYNCKVNNKLFAKSFSYNVSVTNQKGNCCCKCKTTTATRYRAVMLMDEDFKNFLVNEVQLGSTKVTRTGTCISETSVLCRACYLQLKKKKANITYTPRKPKSSSSSSASQEKKAKNDIPPECSSTPSHVDIDDSGPSRELQTVDSSRCAWCGKGASKKGAKLTSVTPKIREHISNVLSKNTSSTTIDNNLNFIHKGGNKSNNCYLHLLNESNLTNYHETARNPVADQTVQKKVVASAKDTATEQADLVHNASNFTPEQADDAQGDICEADLLESNDTDVPEILSELSDFFEELISDKLSDNLPAHLPTIFDKMNEEVDVTKREFDEVVQRSLDDNLHRKIHLSSKKHGRFIYDDRTDFIIRSHELSVNLEEHEEHTFKKSTPTGALASEVFYVMNEMRKHVASAGKLCDVYATYPELLQSITLEQLLFTGLEIKVGGVLTEVPSVDPLLFNFLYFLTCSDEEAKAFEENFSPECNIIYQEGYKSDTKIIYSRVMSTMFDILHQRNKDNIYPLQILFSDMIANTKPTKLIEYLSSLRKCASPRKYDQYKVSMAAQIKDLKKNGEILGLIMNVFTPIHMDNLEQYQKHARNPTKALTSSLVVAAQQPLPTSSSMKLKEGDDVRPIEWNEDNEEDILSHLRNEIDQLVEEEARKEMEKFESDLSATNTSNSEVGTRADTRSYLADIDQEREKADEAERNLIPMQDDQPSKEYKLMKDVEPNKQSEGVKDTQPSKESDHVEDSQPSNESEQKNCDQRNKESLHQLKNEPSKESDLVGDDLKDVDPSNEPELVEDDQPIKESDVLKDDQPNKVVVTVEDQLNELVTVEDDQSTGCTSTGRYPVTMAMDIEDDDSDDDKDYQSDSTACSQTTETTESSDATLEDYERPQTRSQSNAATSVKRAIESSFEFRPRYKRLRLDFGVDHSNIPKYSVPQEAEPELRQSTLEDFICTKSEQELIENLNSKILTHALLQLEGQQYEEDAVKQFVPSFKETVAWGEPVTEKSNTAYLELIPGPPDNVDTILYALSLLKELFVEKLGHVHVVVCGDGKTVNILYKIKDEYGSQMSWLVVMLGTWHLLKTYMEVFFKKYDNVFCRSLLSKVMTKGNVDSVLAAKNWAKSHNFLMWIMAALMRENVKAFQEHHTDGDFSELESNVRAAVDVLRSASEEKITLKDTFDFVNKQKMASDAFKRHWTAYSTFMSIGYASDDQFALFSNALEDFTAYMAVYISIRTGDWTLRMAGIKMMAKVFVRSGATCYQWLVIRHLADLSDPTSYPPQILNRLKAGAWVSALKDSRGATLARDEYHERTASLQIQLRVPKQITEQNMQVLTQYATYGAATRNNLLEEIFRKNDRVGFELAKGCRKAWIDEQEATIQIFWSMLKSEKAFVMENRELCQPFTQLSAKQSTKKDFLGREAFGEDRKDYGKEVLLSYVLPRFCNKKHVVGSEKMPMRKRTLALFPKTQDKKKPSRAKVASKEKEDMIQVLAAGIVQLSSNQQSDGQLSLAGCQIADTPGLFAETQHQPNRKKDKTGLRKVMEKRYQSAFIPPVISRTNTAGFIRDGMQDLFLSPLKHHLTFLDYYYLFVEVKVKPSFAVASTVVIDFDTQVRENLVPKDNLRLVRDSAPSKSCADIDIEDSAIIPPKTSWVSFLANRNNKANLVEFICSKLRNDVTFLRSHEKLIISTGGRVSLSTAEGSIEMDELANNHMECDTRAFFLLSQLSDSKPNWVVKSTDTDFLFTSLLNSTSLCQEGKTIFLSYNTTGQGAKYCCVNELVQQIKTDPQFAILNARSISSPTIFGMLHFLTGCDDLSFLRGFSKNFCFKVFEKYSEKICPENADDVGKILCGDEEVTSAFVLRFLVFLYGHKFSSSFERGEVASLVIDTEKNDLLDVIRKKTWHKTISTNNTMPSLAAVILHSKRFSYVINSFGNATNAFLQSISPEEFGWTVVTLDGQKQIVPQWDSDQNKEEINLIRKSFLRKCGCTIGCRNKMCLCVRNAPDDYCTSLCTCVGCLNRPGKNREVQVDDENSKMLEEAHEEEECQGSEDDEEDDNDDEDDEDSSDEEKDEDELDDNEGVDEENANFENDLEDKNAPCDGSEQQEYNDESLVV